MAHFKEQGEPFVFDFKKLLKALSDKEAVAQSEVDAFMENCAKRWQTREGTYQLKRRRLKPDVRDSPEYPGADIDMADINYWTTWRSTTRWTRTYEGLRGARLFHLVSLSLQISLTDLPGSCLGLCVCVACLVVFVGLVFGFFFWGN